MTESHELVKEAVIARVGADRMAEGLPCIPDPIYGDIIKVQKFRALLERGLEQGDFRSPRWWGDAVRAALK